MQPSFAKGNTHAHRLLSAFALFANHPALRWKENGQWQEMSYATLGRQAASLAALLYKKGIRPREHVVVWHETSWQWIVIDFAIQILGAVTVPIYHSLSQDEAVYILKDCGAKALFGDLKRLTEIPQEISSSLIKVAIDGKGPDGWDQVLTDGQAELAVNGSLKQSLKNPTITPADISTIIYTSGTTGVPKGVVLTHGNVAGSGLDDLISNFLAGKVHTMLLHLPLAHIMGRNVSVPAILYSGSVLAIAEPQRERLPANLKETQATSFITVPYLLDKFMAGALAKIRSQPTWKRKLSEYAVALGRKKRLTSIASGAYRPTSLGPILSLLDRLVLKKIREALGGHLEHIIIGSANSNIESVEFFWGIGIPVYEGYGATETTSAVTYTSPHSIRLGTVGKVCHGMELRLANDGEVLVRGPSVMKGYWNLPEATAEVLDTEGWYHTGDIGQLQDGFLKIVDRKKEIYVLATGKNVAPQGVETALRKTPLILQAFAAGDRKNYITAVIVPDLHAIQKALNSEKPFDLKDSRLHELIETEIEKVTTKLSDYERPKKFMLAAEPFSVENGLLTPTLKLKRKALLQRYEQDIEILYRSAS